mmetsp:Transcript_30716/g.47058  ORF Transcript_30716/g.47058 Transcript_30716/m.47058 type:complete len:97 (+) Transcript_30716:214-504(+)
MKIEMGVRLMMKNYKKPSPIQPTSTPHSRQYATEIDFALRLKVPQRPRKCPFDSSPIEICNMIRLLFCDAIASSNADDAIVQRETRNATILLSHAF